MKLFKVGPILTLAVLFASLETGFSGPFVPVFIPVLITLGGAVACNLLGCYKPNGWRKLEGFDRSLQPVDCDSLDYEVDLILDAHLVMALVPTIEADEAGCKPYLMHANVTDDKMQKEIIEVESKATLFDSLFDAEEQILPLGKYSLNELVDSFENAAVDAYDHDETFDIVENNCGDFLAHFLEHLGHETSEQEMMVIATGLIYTNPDLPTMMREKVIGTLAEDLSDQDLVFSVVKNKMRSMLHE